MEEIKKETEIQSTETDTNDVASEPETATPAETPAEKKNNTKLYTFFAIIIVALLIAGALMKKGVIEEPGLFQDDAVAVVNGVEVSREEYDTSITEITQNATAQGADINDPAIAEQIRVQALTALVNTELLIQKTAELGIVTTPEQAEEEYQLLVEQVGGEEILKERLTELGIDEEELRENISEQVAITAYLDGELEKEGVTVTEEDVATFYETISSGGEDTPPLEEIRPFLEEQILAGKQQEFVGTLIETLRTEADIEMKI